MDIKEYLIQKKEMYTCLLDFIDENEDFSILDKHLQFHESPAELKEFLHLIIILSNYHYRCSDFFEKIEQLLNYFKDDIKQSFSNNELFNLFSCNKRILLFLIKNNIMTIDESIWCMMMKNNDENAQKKSEPILINYFYPELKQFIQKEKFDSNIEYNSDDISNFDEKRLKGENDSYICELIRNDSITEFIEHINKNLIHVSSEIKDSLFETNSLLLEKPPSLIEYAAFFGSIQIFQFLNLNKAELDPSLWLYAIHGNNPEIIHLLEGIGLKPKDESFCKCFEESIKCHHNQIAYYIKDNLMSKVSFFEKRFSSTDFFYSTTTSYCFHYFNYEFFNKYHSCKYLLHYASEFDHIKVVQLLIEKNSNNLIISI